MNHQNLVFRCKDQVCEIFFRLWCLFQDNAEEAEELKAVAAQEKVTQAKEDAPPMSGAMQAAKMAAMDKKEDAEELKKVEDADAVNEESKAALSDALAGKMAAQKQANMVSFCYRF